MKQEIPTWNLYLRYILIATATFSVGTRIVLNIINGPTPIHTLRYYTLQTNLMILIWTVLSIIWMGKEKYSRLTGFAKGALTTYITITWFIFMILIEPTYDPVGVDWWTSLFNHYLNPFMFIADFFGSEREQLEWKWPAFWLVYPLLYLTFALIWGIVLKEYLYFFLNFEELGVTGLIQWTIILSTFFFVVGLGYTAVNRKFLTNYQTSQKYLNDQ